MAVDPNLQNHGAPHAEGSITTSGVELAAAGLTSVALLTAPVAAYAVDLRGRVCLWNHAAETMFGWSPDEVMGRQPIFITADDRPRAIDAFERVLAGELVVHERFSPARRNGEVFAAICSGTLLRNDGGDPIAALTLIRDISAELAADDARRAAEHKWHQLALRTADTITITDIDGRSIENTGQLTPRLGYPASWWKDKSGFELIHAEDIQNAAEAWSELIAAPGRQVRRTYRTRHAHGHYEQVEFTGVNLLHDPVIGGIIIAFRIVSPRQQAEGLVADEARVFELIARDAPLHDILDEIVRIVEHHTGAVSGIVLVDEAAGTVTTGSQGSMSDELLRFVELTPLDTPIQRERRAEQGTEPDADDPLGHGFPVHEPVIVADFEADPRTRPFASTLHEFGFRAAWTSPIAEARTGALYGLLATYVHEAREPTDHERKVSEIASHLAAIAIDRAGWQLELWQQARYDPLTELPNRSLIFEDLDDTLNRARVRHEPVTVVLIDLDRFKLINDSFGHNVGDRLITQFAGRLRSIVGPEHFVGRVGADEFVLVFPPGGRVREARLLAARITKALDEPFTIDGDDIYLTASIGIAMADSGRETADTLLRQADAAMYRAKDLGRDRTEIYDQGHRSRAVARLELSRDLRLALERNELALHYQPEIDCATGAIVGAEALLRWVHPERGLIPPDGFIHIAEETGVIVPIGHWVLDEAVRQARRWTDVDPSIEPFTVSVNLSARQLINRSLVDTVAFVLTRYNWPPSHLTLELTESILIEDRDATLFVLNRLRLLGVKLSIDDFGTGFASLDYLHRLHVDSIKIDRSFVSMLQADGLGSPVATAMIYMAKAFDLTVTAEGVEELDQYRGLQVLQCDLAQGYLFAKPLPADQMELLLREHRRW